MSLFFILDCFVAVVGDHHLVSKIIQFQIGHNYQIESHFPIKKKIEEGKKENE